jgi:hypothetical protein
VVRDRRRNVLVNALCKEPGPAVAGQEYGQQEGQSAWGVSLVRAVHAEADRALEAVA